MCRDFFERSKILKLVVYSTHFHSKQILLIKKILFLANIDIVTQQILAVGGGGGAVEQENHNRDCILNQDKISIILIATHFTNTPQPRFNYFCESIC